MTEFKSVYKVLESLNNKNWTRVDQMASVLELEGAMTVDRYGRLNIATVDEVNKVLEELAYYYQEVAPFDNSFKRTFEHSDSDIHYVGWLESKIPNLQHKHQLWQESIGIHAEVGSEEVVRREPRRQSKFWMLSQAAIFLALKNAMNETQTPKVKGEIEIIISDEGKSRYTIPLMKSMEGAGASMTETTFRANLREIFKTNTLDI